MTATGAKALRLTTGVLALAAVAAMYWILHARDPAPDRIRNAVNFFSYFTILTNLLVGAACLAPVLRPEGRAGRFFSRPTVRSAMALYLVLMALVYAVLLAPIYHPYGLQKWVNHLLHRVVPAMYLADWVLLVPKGTLAPRQIAAWLGYPLAYGAYTLVHGAWSGFYPYPFVAVNLLGYSRVFVNMAVLTVGFALLGMGMVAVDRAMGRHRGRPATNSTSS